MPIRYSDSYENVAFGLESCDMFSGVRHAARPVEAGAPAEWNSLVTPGSSYPLGVVNRRELTCCVSYNGPALAGNVRHLCLN